MILIVSSEDDVSTNHVIDWLEFYNAKYIRITTNTKIKVTRLNITNMEINGSIEINEKSIELSSIQSIWYRRSGLRLLFESLHSNICEQLDRDVNNQIYTEFNVMREFLWSFFEKKSINLEKDNDTNKLIALNYCKLIGLKIPDTLITSKKDELIKFKRKNKEIITKNYSPGLFIGNDNGYFTSSTQIVTDGMIAKLSTEFIPMLFQKNIQKSFEIRAFYLKGAFYSSAIFSQNDEKTKIDFRNYNFSKPNRTPPFKLNRNIEYKLRKLMSLLNLSSGSIDLLVDTKGDYYFLEVNPVGQFRQVSIPCNYRIEEKLALNLIHNE